MVFTAVTATLLAIGALGLIVLDPYDTGRLTPIQPQGMGEGPPWMVNVSRARNPAHDSAVVGNSRTQMLEPERLDAVAGGRFVNLSIQGSAPLEVQAVFATFLRYHPSPRALVIGVDEWWCRPTQQREARFPHWLYATSLSDYLKGLAAYGNLEVLPRRIAVLRGATPMARSDGYWDYSPVYAAMTGGEAAQKRMANGVRPVHSDNPDNRFPALAILNDMLGAAPASTRVVVMWPPTHVSFQPAPGSAADATQRMCQAAIGAAVARRANAKFVNWSGDTEINRIPGNFHDATHYTKKIATALTDTVATALAGLTGGPRVP